MRLPLPKLGALTRQASPLVVGRLLSAALTFALPLVLARVLDAAAFGSYKQIFLVAQTVLLACQLGLTQSLYYFLPREGERRGAFVSQALVLLGVLSLATVGLILGAGPILARHLGDGAIGTLRLPLALIAAGLLFSAPLEAALTSEGKVGLSALIYVLSDALRAALLLVGAMKGGLAGVAWAAAAFAGARVLALGATVALGAIPCARPDLGQLKRQLGYALPLAGSVWLWVAQKQFAQYAVAAHFDAATFALFAVASFHMPVVDIIYAPIGEVLMVRLGKTPKSDSAARVREWDDAVEKLATILWPAAACAWLMGPQLLPMLFTHKYDGAVPLFLLATLELPLWVLPVDGLLRAANETRFLFVWYGARIALTAAVVIGGMRLFGLSGAIAGGVMVEAISRGVMLLRGRRTLGVRLAKLLDGAVLLRIGAASLLAAVPAYAVRFVLDGKLALIVTGAVYGASYLALRAALPARARQPVPTPTMVPRIAATSSS